MKTIKIMSGIFLCFISSVIYAESCHCMKNKSTFCAMADLKVDKTLMQNLIISPDPAGLAIEAKNASTDVNQLLQQYSSQHQCTINAISMAELVSGLLKGTPDMLKDNKNNDDSDEMKKIGGKLIVVDGDKAVCIKKLGLKLPLKTFSPKASKE